MSNKSLLLMLALWAGPAWATTDAPVIKHAKPPRLPAVKFFTDKKDCVYVHPYPQDTSQCVVLFKRKKRWADMKLKGTDKTGVYMGLGVKDLSLYREEGALQFYVRGNKGGETLKAVGFRMAEDKKLKFHYTVTVPLGDYCGVTTKWKMVTIPLADFPLSGKYIQVDEEARKIERVMNLPISNSGDQLYQCRFDWSQVIEMQFEHDGNDDADVEIQISNVVILPKYKLKTVVREKEDIE